LTDEGKPTSNRTEASDQSAELALPENLSTDVDEQEVPKADGAPNAVEPQAATPAQVKTGGPDPAVADLKGPELAVADLKGPKLAVNESDEIQGPDANEQPALATEPSENADGTIPTKAEKPSTEKGPETQIDETVSNPSENVEATNQNGQENNVDVVTGDGTEPNLSSGSKVIAESSSLQGLADSLKETVQTSVEETIFTAKEGIEKLNSAVQSIGEVTKGLQSMVSAEGETKKGGTRNKRRRRGRTRKGRPTSSSFWRE